MRMPNTGPSDVLFALESKPPLRVALGAAFQHLLAIFAGIVTPALIVCGLCGATPALTRQVAGMSLFISGVSTFIQIHRFGAVRSGLLSIQGTSSSFIAIFAGIAAAGTARGDSPEQMLGLMMGMGLVCALTEVGFSQVLPWMRRIITPLVAGIVITLIGLTLIKVSVMQIGGGEGGTFGAPRDVALAAFTAAVVLGLNRMRNPWCRMGALMFGIVAGTAVAALLGAVRVPPWDGAWFLAPVPFRIPLAFRWEWALPVALMYLASTVETIGDITATSMVSDEPTEGEIYEKRLSGGILADGLNSMLATIFGSFPTTSFSQNNGVIQLTGVASRHVSRYISGLLILLGLFPSVAGAIQAVPEPVLGGAAMVMFGAVAASGINILASITLDRRALLIIAVSLALGLGVSQVPEFLAHMPAALRNVLESGVATGGICALLLNWFLPEAEQKPGI